MAKRILSGGLILIFVLLMSNSAFADKQKKDYRVYQYVIEQAEGSFDDVSAVLENALLNKGWQLLAKVDASMPDDCQYRARVFVLYDSLYAAEVMAANRKTGPFAIVDRINLFEDENGLHLSVVNPHSINRTVLMDDARYWDLNQTHLKGLRETIIAAVDGTVSEKEYGQKRKKGKIGKTMGVMAGGDFDGKIENEAVIPGEDWEAVAAKVREGLKQTGEEWHMHLVYEIALPEYETVIFGSTGSPMDSKSFDIVKAGSDKSRKNLACPGLAYAGAYPIEVVVAKEADGVKVRMVNVMYRMKMYFEDAGMWAFMKNMGMPGSIQDELKGQFLTTLELSE